MLMVGSKTLVLVCALISYQVVHKFVEKFNLGLRTLNWVKLRLNFKFEG
jgi:hypothetical protein